MAQVILFGGGDAGGFIIGPNGVRPIPPFDPSIRLQLRGLSALLSGITSIPEKPQREMGKLVNKVSNLIVEQVEAVVGQLDEKSSLVYQDADGGFTCGSGGKPPIPFQWPPRKTPSVGELISGGVVERGLVDFISEASAKKIKLTEILEKPAEVASRLGKRLSERAVQDLQQIAPSRLEKISDPVDREVIQFFHKVADDGRFITTWTVQPAEVAKKLKVQLSDRAFERIVAGGASAIFAPGGTTSVGVGVGVAIAIVVMLVTKDTGLPEIGILDNSGIMKF